MAVKATSKRINIVLPQTTLAVLDRVTSKGSRSRFISRAVIYFIESQGKLALRERLKQEALDNAGRDVAMAAEWFPLEEEASRRDSASGRRAANRKTRRS